MARLAFVEDIHEDGSPDRSTKNKDERNRERERGMTRLAFVEGIDAHQGGSCRVARKCQFHFAGKLKSRTGLWSVLDFNFPKKMEGRISGSFCALCVCV